MVSLNIKWQSLIDQKGIRSLKKGKIIAYKCKILYFSQPYLYTNTTNNMSRTISLKPRIWFLQFWMRAWNGQLKWLKTGLLGLQYNRLYLNNQNLSTFSVHDSYLQHKSTTIPVQFPWECCTCKVDMSHSSLATSQYMQSENDGCRVEHEGLLRLRMN